MTSGTFARLAVGVVLGAAAGGCASRHAGACDVLSPQEIAAALRATDIRRADGSGLNRATGVDTCRWTADDKPLELRIYRADSSAEDAWKLVFESSQAYATRPDASGRTRGRALTGVGDAAMLLFDAGSGASVAFLAGRTGATIGGTASEDALIELARLAAGRLRK